MAIPIASTTLECVFSALKRVESRLRLSIVQERLDALILMNSERKMLVTFDKEKICDIFANTFRELTNALII